MLITGRGADDKLSRVAYDPEGTLANESSGGSI